MAFFLEVFVAVCRLLIDRLLPRKKSPEEHAIKSARRQAELMARPDNSWDDDVNRL